MGGGWEKALRQGSAARQGRRQGRASGVNAGRETCQGKPWGEEAEEQGEGVSSWLSSQITSQGPHFQRLAQKPQARYKKASVGLCISLQALEPLGTQYHHVRYLRHQRVEMLVPSRAEMGRLGSNRGSKETGLCPQGPS